MTDHPLTDEKTKELIAPELIEDWIPIEEAMRLSADWQLTKVLEWLDENLCNYDTGTDTGFFEPTFNGVPMSRLLPDLEKAMRPQEGS